MADNQQNNGCWEKTKNYFKGLINYFKINFILNKTISEPSCENITKLVLMFFIIVFTIAIMIFSREMNFDSEITKSISNEFIENFKRKYFLDFYKCNPNDEKVILDKWQGTIKGCGTIINGKKTAYVLDTGKECKNDEIILEKIPLQDIKSFKGLSICGNIRDDKNYYELLFSDSIVGEFEDCPEGTKNCGYIDTINNKLCLKNNSDCPINYIHIRDINSPPPTDITNLKNITGERIRFYYSNNPYAGTSTIPHIQNSFKIADDQICALPNLYHSNIDLFILDAYKKELVSDCVLKDYSQKYTVDTIRYSELNSINQYELYEENGIIEKIKSHNLIDYGFEVDKYRDNTLKLYVRTNFGFNKTCLKERKTNFNIQELTDILSTSDKMFEASDWLYMVGYPIIVLILVESILDSKDCGKCLEKIINIITSVGSAGEFAYIIFWALTYDDPYEQNMKCSDFISNSNYNVMIEKIKNNGNKLFICAVLIIFLLIFSLGLFIFNIIGSCYKEKKCGCCSEQNGCCCECCKKCFTWIFMKTCCCNDINNNPVIRENDLNQSFHLQNINN